MAAEKVNIERFLELSEKYPVLDVRSPGEYLRAHIPGAISFPLFSDEERKVVGTAYKQQSREIAIKIGLDYFGIKMRKMVEEAEAIVRSATIESDSGLPAAGSQLPIGETRTKSLLVHCWRGGMRSAAIAWLLDLYGFKVYTLVGGYKKYRNWVIDTYSKSYAFRIVGGCTGSAKTYVMKTLGELGESMIDLEDLAKHKGSAFGNIGMPEQPSQEMFENLLSKELHLINSRRMNNPITDSVTDIHSIWLEDESQRIGDINLPHIFWKNMRQSPIYFLEIPFEERLGHIIKEYGSLDRDKMAQAIERIQKRLGGLETKTSLELLKEGNIEGCFRILLKYYDKWYSKGLNNRDDLKSLLHNIKSDTVDPIINANKLINTAKR